MYSVATYKKDTFYGRLKRGLPRTEDMLLNQRVKYTNSFDIGSDLLIDDDDAVSTEWERTNQLISETTSAVLSVVDRLRQINTSVINLLEKDDITFKRVVTTDRYKALRSIADKTSGLAQDYEQDRQEVVGVTIENEPHSTRVLTEELVLVMGNSAATLRQYVVNMRLLFSRVEDAKEQGEQFFTTVSGDELWESRTKFYEYAL